MFKPIEIPNQFQNEAIQKLNEIQKLLDDGEDQSAIHFVIDAVAWLINDRVDQLKKQRDSKTREYNDEKDSAERKDNIGIAEQDYQPESTENIESTEDLLFNSISSFGITVASQGGNPEYLYEEYKLKKFFQHLARNGIEVSFKVKAK